MNLHIFQDSLGYFLDGTVNRIERLDKGNNLYLNLNTELKIKNQNVTYIPFDFNTIGASLDEYKDIKRVYLHFYNYVSKFCLERIKRHHPDAIMIWVFWSAEFYSLPEFEHKLYLPFSRKFLARKLFQNKWRSYLSKVKSIITGRPFYNHKELIKSYYQLDYLASLLEKDYEQVVAYSKAPIKYLPFAYVSYDQLIDHNLLKEVRHGNKIMVNHSADPSLNHYEILKQLSLNEISNPVFVPLAYGNNEYAKAIEEEGRKLLGGQIEFQLDFIPKEVYSKKMLELGYAIFNIPIQQGLGNLLALLWVGVKVFLREENTAYQNFKEWGLHVYSIQKDLPSETFTSFLSEDQIQHNRSILEERFSNAQVDEYFINMLNVN